MLSSLARSGPSWQNSSSAEHFVCRRRREGAGGPRGSDGSRQCARWPWEPAAGAVGNRSLRGGAAAAGRLARTLAQDGRRPRGRRGARPALSAPGRGRQPLLQHAARGRRRRRGAPHGRPRSWRRLYRKPGVQRGQLCSERVFVQGGERRPGGSPGRWSCWRRGLEPRSLAAEGVSQRPVEERSAAPLEQRHDGGGRHVAGSRCRGSVRPACGPRAVYRRCCCRL